MDHSDVAEALLYLSRGDAATGQHNAQVQSHSAGFSLPQFV